MPRKGNTHAEEDPTNKMKGKVTSVSEEVEILNELDKGLCTAVVRQHCSARKMIFGLIKENEDRIR
jgi:hypothetical protein